jgi:hypothetical protein
MIRLPFFARTSAALLAFVALLSAGESRAEVPLKGMIGCGLIGAELVTGTEALLGVRQPWLYAVSGVAGAAGGAVGGYFLEKNTSPQIALFTFFGGLGLIIPATILVTDALNHPATPEPEAPPAPKEPTADPSGPSASPELSIVLPPSPKGRVALLWLEGNEWMPRVPTVHVGGIYTPRELSQFSISQVTEVGFPVVGGRF